MTLLGKEDILRGLRAIDGKAKEAGIVVDISIYGGAALAIAYDIRHATRDVDAVAHGSPDFLRKTVAEIAEDEGWPEDWFNDGVKGFTAANEKMRLMEDFSDSAAGGLRIYTPAPEYLFAMKCMAMRSDVDGSHDISDIKALANTIGITDAGAALSIVESFYPASRIPPKVKFGVEQVMEDMQKDAATRVAAADKLLQNATKNLPQDKQAEVMGQFQAKMQNPENVDKLSMPMKLVREMPDRVGPTTNRKDDKEHDR